MFDANDGETQPTPVNPTDFTTGEDMAGDQAETAPTPAVREAGDNQPDSDTGQTSGGPNQPARSRWPLITFAGVLALIVIASLSAFSGYRAGINLRKQAEVKQVAQVTQQQFNLGVQELAAGQYGRARQRFEYVIGLDPGFPGVTEKLAEVLLYLNATATPTPLPTATPAPTPKVGTPEAGNQAEGQFKQAEGYLANSDWTNAIDTLLIVRKTDPNYRSVDIDGMLYLALRNRGRDKISKLADLEGGTYDLALAKRFGPLDSETEGLLTWASLYKTGASFWELDWEQAVYYFAQVAPQLPSLRDGSGMTATERYRLALIGYGDTLVRNGSPCEAQEQYQLSLSIGPDTKAEEGLAEAARQCEGAGSGGEQPSGGEEPPPPTPELLPPPPGATAYPPPP